MPYSVNTELPLGVQKHLSEHAQDIYREAFNHAYETYKDTQKRRDLNESLEGISHKIAWGAVKKKYQKGEDNNWHEKENIV